MEISKIIILKRLRSKLYILPPPLIIEVLSQTSPIKYDYSVFWDFLSKFQPIEQYVKLDFDVEVLKNENFYQN